MENHAQADRLRCEMARLVRAQLRWILGRVRNAYPFIDTKWDLAAKAEVAADDAVRGPGAVYVWIQGRGLESLATHAVWLERAGDSDDDRTTVSQIDRFLPLLVASMEQARARNGGRLPFLMAPDGTPLDIGPAGVAPDGSAMAPGHSLSDLFYARGLAAAADRLGDEGARYAARSLFDRVLVDIRGGAFRSGQIALDPRNPVAAVPGRHSHAGRMIALGGATLFWKITGDDAYARTGLEFIDHILDRHTRHHADAKGPAGDFWEFIDDAGRPWENAGKLWSDPGHATEFAGLAFAHIEACYPGGDAEREARLRKVLFQNFENGFTGLGIVKAFDLHARRPINGDMPWWSLPETIRAAELAMIHAPAADQVRLAEITRRCWDAFVQNYTRRDQGMMAIQCLSPGGKISSAIPATPDLDPGYHTGLPLIACLRRD